MKKYEQLQLRENDVVGLLKAAHTVFPEILMLNLTQDTYRILQYDDNTTLGTPGEGRIDDMIHIRLGGVIEADRENFVNTFSGQALRKAFLDEQKESVQLLYRRPKGDGNICWFETTAMRSENVCDDDVLLVGVSRIVDTKKVEEIHLQEQLKAQQEEIQLTMSYMGKSVSHYDIPTSTITINASKGGLRMVPSVIKDFPESFMSNPPEGFLPETLAAMQEFYHAIRSGEPSGICEYRLQRLNGEECWEHLEFVSFFDTEGHPMRAVIVSEDVTAQHIVGEENNALKENEHILRLLVQHSERTICYYDIQKERAHIWDQDVCSKCPLPRLCERHIDDILESGEILPESVDEVRSVFQDIRAGKSSGETKMRIRTRTGERHWFSLKYSSVFDEKGTPVSALISCRDINVQYEHELAYLRQMQMLEDSKDHLGIIEVDLTTDMIESQGGQLTPPGALAVGRTLSDFGQQMVSMKLTESDRLDGLMFFSREYLLPQYAEGSRQLERAWQMQFRNETLRWVNVLVELMRDPYTGHVKAFIRMTDITEKKEHQMELLSRSEHDGMTGLLNRAAAEERIREHLIARTNPGILILLDLDDLKGINDHLGHPEGDRAIMGIAAILKGHFRETDVIGRLGGDEFIIYLPGAAENYEAISASLTSLLRKLAAISVGENNERRVQCSIGCTIQTPETNSFEVLYNRVDTALYHVKRNGKNNFAFYSPEMECEDYQFRSAGR